MISATTVSRAPLVSEHFSWSEIACPCCGFAIVDGALLTALEMMRKTLGVAINVNSWTRCQKHNAEEGGVKGSQHLLGKAVDIWIKGVVGDARLALIDRAKSEFGFAFGKLIEHSTRAFHLDVRGVTPKSWSPVDLANGGRVAVTKSAAWNAACTVPATFDATCVVHDDWFEACASMNAAEIDAFLRTKKSPLALAGIAGTVFAACQASRINPKLVLAKFQCEQGLIEWNGKKPPTDEILDKALGVGVCDYADGHVVVNPGRLGIEKQIRGCCETLRKWFDRGAALRKAGKRLPVYLVKGGVAQCGNLATFALFQYTPHVEAQKLVYDVLRRYFPGDVVQDPERKV